MINVDAIESADVLTGFENLELDREFLFSAKKVGSLLASQERVQPARGCLVL